MSSLSSRLKLGSSGHIAWNLVLISVGSFICALSINGILVPRRFLAGGFGGVALFVHYLLPQVSVAVAYFVLNIPLFALGWKFIGRRFFFYSLAGMTIFSALVAVTRINLQIQDQLLAALLAGILSGAGSGIILRSAGSAGGLDILNIIVLKRFSVRLGTTVLAFNSLILLCGSFQFNLDIVLYTLIYMFMTSKVMEIFVTGLSQRKVVIIISAKWRPISHEIMYQINRGITLIPAEGGFSGSERKIIYSVIAYQQLPAIKRIITSIDPDAFVVVTDTLEVMGARIGNQPHW